MAVIKSSQIKQVDKNKQTLVIHNNKVYDITKFVNVHPGGKKTLSCRHGRDITTVMEKGPHKHSKNAYRWLEQYYIAEYFDDSRDKTKSTLTNGISTDVQVVDGVLKVVQSNNDQQEKDLVNWDEPVLWQVGYLGAEYHDWIDEPVDKPLRLFHSDFCEYFSKTKWYAVPLVWFPVMSMFLWSGYKDLSALVSSDWGLVCGTCMLFAIGIFAWSFLEYSLHRWLFHSDPPITSYFLITLHFLLHGQHHKVPFDRYRLVFPPVPAAIMLVIFYSLMWLAVPRVFLHSTLAGIIFGYVCYDMTHYYLHYGSPLRGSYFDRLRAYHVRHHFESPDLGFGISSKFWDYPFQTVIPLDSKKKDY